MDFFNLFYKFDNTLEKVKKPLYLSLMFLIYFSYFLIFAGLYYVNTSYIDKFSILLQIFVCIFLMIRFHPFRKHELREFDASIIFTSAFLLLTNAGLTEFAKKDLEAIAKYI